MEISLKQIEAFVKVAECGSFTKAGAELYISQSTVSAHILNLERELNAALIWRGDKKSVSLTDDGRRFYREASVIISRVAELQNMFAPEGGAAESANIAIAASTELAGYILPRLIAGFSEIHPESSFSVTEGGGADSLERLFRGEAAFALTDTAARKGLFSYQRLCPDDMVLVTPASEEFRAHRAEDADLRVLLRYPFIMRESGTPAQARIVDCLAAMGIYWGSLNIACSIGSIEAVKRMTAAGRGVSLLPGWAVRDSDEGILRFPVNGLGRRSIYLASRQGDSPTQMERAFAEYAKRSGADALLLGGKR